MARRICKRDFKSSLRVLRPLRVYSGTWRAMRAQQHHNSHQCSANFFTSWLRREREQERDSMHCHLSLMSQCNWLKGQSICEIHYVFILPGHPVTRSTRTIQQINSPSHSSHMMAENSMHGYGRRKWKSFTINNWIFWMPLDYALFFEKLLNPSKRFRPFPNRHAIDFMTFTERARTENNPEKHILYYEPT